MKKESDVRRRLNKLIVDYFNGKFGNQEKSKAEQRIRELVWVLEETILLDKGKTKLIGKET